MFSGLIERMGTVAAIESDAAGGVRLRVALPDELRGEVRPKDSVAVNGVCLTVTEAEDGAASFDVIPETLSRSTLGGLQRGEAVNVELALRVGDRIGGHFVYGHVDTAVRILAREREGQGERVTFELPPQLAAFVCEKAFVSLDGVSLTVAGLAPNAFTVALIPETLRRTTLGARHAGDRVNLEVDPLARYAAGAIDVHANGVASDELAWAYEI